MLFEIFLEIQTKNDKICSRVAISNSVSDANCFFDFNFYVEPNVSYISIGVEKVKHNKSARVPQIADLIISLDTMSKVMIQNMI